MEKHNVNANLQWQIPYSSIFNFSKYLPLSLGANGLSPESHPVNHVSHELDLRGVIPGVRLVSISIGVVNVVMS
jgi:hypothetical protein